MRASLGTAVGLGAVTGLRTFTGAALLARELSRRTSRRVWWARDTSRLEELLAEPAIARAIQVMAAGELIADKLPGMPDRITPGPLAGRALIGAILGALVVGEDRRAIGALAGGSAAVAATFAGWWLRREAARATYLPDAALALAEDALAVVVARELAAEA